MATFHNFSFSNGLAFKYFTSTKQRKNEDRHVIIESLVKYLEDIKNPPVEEEKKMPDIPAVVEPDTASGISIRSFCLPPKAQSYFENLRREKFDCFKDFQVGEPVRKDKDKIWRRGPFCCHRRSF